MASHVPALPLEYFDEHGVFETDDSAGAPRSHSLALISEGNDTPAAVFDPSTGSTVGSWRAAWLTAARGDDFEGRWADSDNGSFTTAGALVAFGPSPSSKLGSKAGSLASHEAYLSRCSDRIKRAMIRRRAAEALIRYHLFVECMPLNARSVGMPYFPFTLVAACELPACMCGIRSVKVMPLFRSLSCRRQCSLASRPKRRLHPGASHSPHLLLYRKVLR